MEEKRKRWLLFIHRQLGQSMSYILDFLFHRPILAITNNNNIINDFKRSLNKQSTTSESILSDLRFKLHSPNTLITFFHNPAP
jgi:hypothetical protein